MTDFPKCNGCKRSIFKLSIIPDTPLQGNQWCNSTKYHLDCVAFGRKSVFCSNETYGIFLIGPSFHSRLIGRINLVRWDIKRNVMVQHIMFFTSIPSNKIESQMMGSTLSRLTRLEYVPLWRVLLDGRLTSSCPSSSQSEGWLFDTSYWISGAQRQSFTPLVWMKGTTRWMVRLVLNSLLCLICGKKNESSCKWFEKLARDIVVDRGETLGHLCQPSLSRKSFACSSEPWRDSPQLDSMMSIPMKELRQHQHSDDFTGTICQLCWFPLWRKIMTHVARENVKFGISWGFWVVWPLRQPEPLWSDGDRCDW